MVRVVNARDIYACLYRVTNGRLAAGCRYIPCSISIYAGRLVHIQHTLYTSSVVSMQYGCTFRVRIKSMQQQNKSTHLKSHLSEGSLLTKGLHPSSHFAITRDLFL